jgi:hypothetical protein
MRQAAKRQSGSHGRPDPHFDLMMQGKPHDGGTAWALYSLRQAPSMTARFAHGHVLGAGIRWLCARCWAELDSRRPPAENRLVSVIEFDDEAEREAYIVREMRFGVDLERRWGLGD